MDLQALKTRESRFRLPVSLCHLPPSTSVRIGKKAKRTTDILERLVLSISHRRDQLGSTHLVALCRKMRYVSSTKKKKKA